ncbi:MAG: acyl-CoA dehydrogenase [Candidatus Latescibacteria bacterium]|nr:acyl-CoA dehydrogenase [Candidatus Latescibacterota bacterium]NIM64470.1 acyl-CoA dehydrogenase [Candidatus Latescibacterota bacterium]NIO00623.1 acyl-CoA dehydrogenase [Candidatus Latescibacterota bacterium]NIO27024.1 acyl-CoA dehydrogenase [Candidatus Latescibacterota bacterium]NIO56101.1 acyl-CoA dehydrogenase [Candidatus Latescibacterota bacterium]
MDFRFSDEQEFFRASIEKMVDRLIRPRIQEIDEADEFPHDLWKELADLKYLGLRHPEKYGGMNVDTITSMIFYEELARGACGFAMSVTMQILMGTYFVGRFGSEEIKQRVLVPAIKGEKMGTICFTEEHSGSDLAGTRTTASKKDGGWVINGRKIWITSSPMCDFCTVLATTDPSKGLEGLSFFLVEKGTKGFSSGQTFAKLGCHGSVTGELVFDNVWVPDENLLGEGPGNGLKYTTDILNEVRVMTALFACAIANEAMSDARKYALDRVAFGKSIAKYQLIRVKFANHWAWYEAARLFAYKCAWMIQEGMECQYECMLAKMFATEMCMSAVDEASRIYGGNSFAMEYPQQRFFRDARFLLFGGGCHEVLQNALGAAYLRKE